MNDEKEGNQRPGKNIFKYTADFYITYLIFIHLLFVLHMSMVLLLSRQKSHIQMQKNQNLKVSHCLERGTRICIRKEN